MAPSQPSVPAPPAVAAAPRRSARPAAAAAMSIAVVLAGLQGVAAWWLAWAFQLFGSEPDRADHLLSVGCAASAATLLTLGAVACWRLRGRVAAVLAALGAVLLVVLGAWSWEQAATVAAGAGELGEVGNGVVAVVYPGAWPLGFVLVLALAVTVRDRRG